MKIDNSISPENFNLIVLAAGLFAAFVIWKTIDGRTAQLRYEPVYGEIASQASDAVETDRLQALPLVEAKGVSEAGSGTRLNDQAIEAAFRQPVFAIAKPEVEEVIVEVAKEPEPPQVTLDQRFLMTYRPLIGGVNANGAVINGVYWKAGEKIVLMPIQDSNSEVIHYPVLKRIRSDSVVLALANSEIKVGYERY